MTKIGSGGRPRVGSTYMKDGVRQIAISTNKPGAPRPRWVRSCPQAIKGVPTTETEAKIMAADLQRKYDRGEWDPWEPAVAEAPVAAEPPRETLRAWSVRWLDARTTSGLRSVGDDRVRLELHVLPLIGDVPVSLVTRAQVEDVRDSLDTKARGGELAASTALKVWGIVTKMFKDARSSKNRALRARTDNPCVDVQPPDRAPEKASAYLYPSELLALVSCARVPLRWRRLFALAVYTYARAAELEALEWDSVDLERGIIHIHQAADRATGEVRGTKTGNTRRFTLEPGILPMLRAMHAEADGKGRVIAQMPPREDGASYLRTCLGYAGITRAELFARSKTRRPIDFHDLRATGITWLAIRGEDPLRIQQRAGHLTFSTTQRYIREAENLRGEGFGALFPHIPLGGAIPSPTQGSATGSATKKTKPSETEVVSEGFLVTPTGFEPVFQT